MGSRTIRQEDLLDNEKDAVQAIEYDRGTKNYQGENLKRSHTAQQQGDNLNQRITSIQRPYLTHSELRKGHLFSLYNGKMHFCE